MPSKRLLQIRAEIDTIDKELVHLLARRSDAVIKAGFEKPSLEIIAERRQAVLSHVRTVAARETTRVGHPGFVHLVERVYGALVDASIEAQLSAESRRSRKGNRDLPGG